ncbi:PAS domain S-box-containing protein [Microvirga lupini]|uniref:Blue-light-activated histidine kinase n=1 Tax=Microvirga lupini TaxID=420324 RepID=A0A7W4VK06_9HYPH|nr:HWE histidine kinase domain-containing protein [Microvirga lupini]MBB3018618.1 PAS domain S-box-containing protein [Microvirga lupini]
MFHIMNAPNPALAASFDLEQLTSDLVASISASPRGALSDALQQALARTVEAKVNAQLAVILEGIGDAFYSLDAHWRFSYINRAAEAYFGLPRQAMLHRVIWDVFPESEGTDLRGRYEEVFLSGHPLSFEGEAVGRPGRHLEFHVFPYNGGIGVSFRDWTERRRAEEELRASEARLSALANNAPACMFYQTSHSPDYHARKVLYVSKTCERLTGVPAEVAQANPDLLYSLVLPQHRDRMLARRLETLCDLTECEEEFEMRHATTGETRWHRIITTPRRLENGAIVWDGIQIDITEHKRSEEHLRLLLNELNHRVKNTLATIQSLASQSFRVRGATAAGDLPALYATFEARLHALARGHDILTRENWEGAGLVEIVTQAFAPYRDLSEDRGRLRFEGPDLRVTPAMALSLSMAMHELCTNAAKYGALGVPEGQVLVSWSAQESASGPRLVMRWEEHGGPLVAPPSRKGFGSRLIQDGLARELNGEVRLTYQPEGVVCTIDVPLS